MNKIYKLVWSKKKEMWVAVSEKVAAGWFKRPLIAGALALATLLASFGPANAVDLGTLPTGGQVVAGRADISQSGKAMTISQHTDKMIANWNTFNIGQNASVAFRQPGASSVALNRIFDQNPSQIYGRLSANGQVFLMNPAGVYFGPTAQVDVGGLVASSLNLSNENFLTGKYHFENTGIAGSIINQGQIRTADGGYVAFLSPRITNEGTISTPGGTVALAAGDKVSLDFTGDKLVTFTVDQGAIDALIENKGLIKADGGLVKMTAKAADELTSAVVNNEGVIEAKGLTAKGGRIILDGHEVTNSGRLDASARASDAIPNSPEGTGGAIALLGNKVALTGNAALDASGDSGGGSILIGGNYRGKGPEPNAKETFVGDNVKITADAVTSGNGGRVIVWADDKTTFNGSISARGGAHSGDGGFVETSGHKLKIGETAFVDTRAPFGITGSWLLDPNNITIAAAGGDFTGAQVTGWLGSSDVIITTSDLDNGYSTDGGSSYTPAGSAGNGDIFVNDSITWSSHKLTLDAWRNIEINRELFGSAAAQLALYYGQGAVNAGNTATYKVSAPVNLGAGNNFFTRLGNDAGETAYTVITSLGAADSVTGTDLQGINGNKGGNYVLGANIDASSTSGWNSGAGFLPVGNNTNKFTGQLDGLGHAITGLYINRPESDAATGGYYIGLFGYTDGAAISNVGITGGSVTGTYYVGGLAGWNDGTISNSYATGSVSVTGAIIGGLVGNNSSTISNSYVTGSVSGGNNVGGLVGRNYGTISNSYVTGPVSGVDYVGGLAAGNYGTISNSYVTGPVSGDDYVSGLAGVNTGTISNSYWDKETSGQLTSAGGTGLTTAQMMQRANFTGFDFNNVWYLPDNFQGNTRPFLRSEYSTTIGNAHQLQLMDMDKGASYTLAKNIDMSELKQAAGMWGGTGASANKGFVPVGNDTNKFTGQFDGQGFTVTGLYINRSGTDYAGLFGYTDGAAISNAGITGGSVTGNYCVGGLAGYNKNSAIESSYATGVVTGNGSVGGLVGYNTNSTIESSYATGVVTGNDYAGGLAGWNNGTISNSYATGAVSGTNHVGGLVGNNSSTISNSYATGAVSGTNYVGGFVGYDDGGSSCYTANFWDTETSGTTLGVGSGNLDNVTGRATSAMMTRKTFTDAGWTFNADNWGIYSAGGDVNISYPYLSKRFPAAPQIVSGTLTGDGVAGKTVRLAKGGVDYGPSSAGANRFYYFAVDSGSIAEADPYLLYISDSAVKGGMVYKNSFNSGTNKTGSGITGGTLFIADAGLSGSGIAGIRGSLGDADYPYFPYAVSGNNITVVSGLDFETASGSTFTLNGDITASSGAITFRAATELGANTTLDTSGGNNNINFNSTLDGSYTLGLTAGTGDIVFSDQAGSASALGLVTINSAKNVTVPDAFKSAGITQKAGTGTTIFDGAVTATGDVNIKTATIDINENLVAVGKKVTLNASTLVDLASGKSITTTAAENSEAASGAVDIDATGTGAVNLSGDIITTGAANNAGTGSAGGAVTIDTANGTIAVNKITASGGASTGGTNKGGAAGAITINSTTAGNNITLNGDLASVGGAGSAAQGAGGNINPKGSGSIILGKGITIDTGATAGNITFSSVLDGTSDYAEDLTLNAGTGTVGFGRNKVTGGVKKLGNITIQSAGNVQVSSSLNAKSVSATNSGTFLLSGSSATITARDGFSVSGNARMETCGITTNGGNLTIDGTLTIWGAKGDVLTTATLTTGGGALTITGITDGTLKDSGVETLILDAGAGAINVAALGSGSDKMLTDVTIDNAGTTNFNGAVNLTGALTQSAGTGATTFKSTVATGGKLLIVTGGNIQLDAGAAITSGAAGDAIILAAGGNFINNRGSDALATTAGGSRWLVYSNDPTTDNFGSPVLASGNSAVWNKTYATYDKADAGNRYVFAASPSLTFTAKNFSKTYGEDKTAAMTGQDARDYSYTVTSNLSAGYGAGTAFSDTPWDSQFSGDPLVTSAGSAATAHVSGGPYNIGIDAAGVSEAGYTIVVHDGDSYGKLTIDKLALSGSIATGNSIYGDNLTPGAATFTNKVSGDDITAAISVDTTGLLSSSGKLKAGTHTGIEYISALTGEDADNYTYADVKGNYTVNKLALTGTAIAGVSTTYGTAKDPGAVSFTNIQSKDGTFDKVASSASLVDPSNSTSGNLKAGTYKQTATAISGADAANYSFGGFTSDANYTINTKPITIAGITASNKVYDANNSAATDTTKASGWIAGDSCSVSATGLFDNKNVGTNKTVVLTSSYTGDDKRNYAITDQATTTADINAAPLTVTANDKTKTYGEAVTFNGTEFTSTELVGGETIGLVTLASLGADANAAVAGSPYTIVASDAKNGTFLPSNYAITYNDGALTINKALLDIKANNDTKTHTGNPYRGGNGVVYTGFVNGEAENVLAGALTYGGTSQGAVNAGTYGIDPSGLTSGNYNINFTNGTLVITGGQTQKQVETVESAITSSQNSINGTQDGQGNNPGAPHTGSMGPGSGSGNIVMTTVLTTGSATGSVLTTTTFSTPVAFSTAGQTMTLSITDAPSSGAMTEVGTLPIFSQIGGATPAFQGNFVVNQSGSAVSLTPSTTGTATAIPPTTLTGEKSAPFTLTMQNGLSLQMIATVTPDGTLVVSAPDSAGEVNVQQAILMGAQVAKQSLQVELGSLSSALFVRN